MGVPEITVVSTEPSLITLFVIDPPAQANVGVSVMEAPGLTELELDVSCKEISEALGVAVAGLACIVKVFELALAGSW
jgi:hypothetical protein